MIEIKNIVKQYNGVPVINNLNLTVNDGEFVVLIGPSGCGKTTTLKMINRLIEADSGDILINGKSIHELNGEKTAAKYWLCYPTDWFVSEYDSRREYLCRTEIVKMV